MNKWERRTNQTTGKTFPKSYFKPTKIIRLWNHTCRFSTLLKYFLFYLISWSKFFKILIVQVLDQSHNTMNKWVRRTNQTTGKTFPKSYFKPTKIIKLWNHTCRFSRLLKYFLFYLISWLKFFKILIVQVLDQLMMAREINVSYSFRLEAWML